ncbi:MAG: hypothetical protein HBSAPP02_08910 [Phycisphaerae bacterium]|nr:MAG: hypothetical protein DCC66_00955 [Planctomycetota bacterium]GJQ25859.1 MAG: hypothetical protein HBSAPP02_08910 [Phycisphaerae bacterium]
MQKVKIGIIVGAIALAGIITFMCNKDQEPIEVAADDPKSPWLCAACNHQFELNSKEEFEAAQKVPNNLPPLLCPQCKARQAWRANICEECGTAYFGAEVPNSTGVCPKCHPDAKPKAPEDVEEEEQGVEEGVREEGTQRVRRAI